MKKSQDMRSRLDRSARPSIQGWKQHSHPDFQQMKTNVSIEMGWGRLIFGHTFDTNENLAEAIRAEEENQRDIAFYIRDPDRKSVV